MYQSFIGYEVKIFNKIELKKNNAYIMHNMHIDSNNFYFEYILPLKENIYLFELTTFSNKKVTFQVVENKLKKILLKYFNSSYQIIRKEYGIIPMGFIDKSLVEKSNNYYVSGSLSGAIRPSSGYAFIDIQKWANESTNKLKKCGNLKTISKPEYIKDYLDKIFLKVISTNIKMTP